MWPFKKKKFYGCPECGRETLSRCEHGCTNSRNRPENAPRCYDGLHHHCTLLPQHCAGPCVNCNHPEATIDMDHIGKPEDPVVYKCKCGARWVEITTPITLDNLPRHPLQEEDGAFWRAIREPSDPKGWRWQPLNLKAFGKTGPTGPMTDYYRPRQEEPHG